MVLPRLYCPSLTLGLVELPREESHHVLSVLRASPGDEVELFDGRGAVATGVLTHVQRKVVQVQVPSVARVPFDSPFQITLAVAMPKLHRQGFLVEKCTELGVAALWPITSKRSVTRPSDGALEKWSRRAVESCKQSRRAWIPTIIAAQGIEVALQQASDFDAIVFTQRQAEAIWADFLTAQEKNSRIFVAVGPEGGWTENELDYAKSKGALLTSLAPAILRTETAAIAVCAVAAALGTPHSRRYSDKHQDEPNRVRP
ncbi:MAG: RsmE family RNA methyltransferase [Planctomycetota bacterium]